MIDEPARFHRDYIQDPAIWSAALGSVPDRPAFFGLHHLWKNAGGDGGFSWVHKNAWQGTPDESSPTAELLFVDFSRGAAHTRSKSDRGDSYKSRICHITTHFRQRTACRTVLYKIKTRCFLNFLKAESGRDASNIDLTFENEVRRAGESDVFKRIPA